jgi:prefoldin subunit 5
MPLREQLLKKQIEMLQAKLDALRGTMLDADETIRAITSAGEKVKTSLLSELPTKVVEFAQTKSTIDAIESVKTAITDALNSISKIPEDVARKGAK